MCFVGCVTVLCNRSIRSNVLSLLFLSGKSMLRLRVRRIRVAVVLMSNYDMCGNGDQCRLSRVRFTSVVGPSIITIVQQWLKLLTIVCTALANVRGVTLKSGKSSSKTFRLVSKSVSVVELLVGCASSRCQLAICDSFYCRLFLERYWYFGVEGSWLSVYLRFGQWCAVYGFQCRVISYCLDC